MGRIEVNGKYVELGLICWDELLCHVLYLCTLLVLKCTWLSLSMLLVFVVFFISCLIP